MNHVRCILHTAILSRESLIDTFAPFFPDGADIVVDVTGVPSVINSALKIAKDLAWDDKTHQGARFILQGSDPDLFEVSYRTAFT